MKKIKILASRLFLLMLIFAGISSCEVVKEYQKAYLNDDDMQLGGRKLESFETSWENYREGASGGSGSKSGGGCGCN